MSQGFLKFNCEGFQLGLAPRLGEISKQEIVSLIKDSRNRRAASLAGRGLFGEGSLPGVGRVFIKQYARGGWFGRLVWRSYLRWGKTRGEREFDFLQRARKIGVNAPEPLGFAVKGAMFCNAWLMTEYIDSGVTLSEMSVKDEERTSRVLLELVRNIAILVRHSIKHIDLHPGNVLIGPKDQVYILDFDKAQLFRGSTTLLRDYYLRRWRRAVIKHNLPDYLSEIVSLGLRQHEHGERSTYV
ncbi:MAG: phosphotransferase [Deltaproteobacteria bacterium]|nr:phosphotransferase [Deltaproteobacteria bacterium]